MTKLQHISWATIFLILGSSSIDISHAASVSREAKVSAIAAEQPVEQQENDDEMLVALQKKQENIDELNISKTKKSTTTTESKYSLHI
ncbi:MAG: hypothetical protein RLZZ74_2374 [Cyanobacteriota bacterium]|jgi:hypothetical protein